MTKPSASAVPSAGVAALIAAKTHTSMHRAEIEASTRCACFFCFRFFPSGEIKAWIDSNSTALCPSCGVDAVLGDASGFSISDGHLRKLHQQYFAYRSR